MTAKTKITVDAEDKKPGMTLNEITAFAARAREAKIPDDTQVKVTTRFRSQITSLAVEA